MIAQQAPQLTVPRFVDVEPERLAAEEGVLRSARQVLTGAWSDYLRRVLPPLRQQDVPDLYSAASA
jgi:hypothetical protein